MNRFIKSITIIFIVCGVFSVTNVKEAYAQTLHENPEQAQQIFSGIPLFQYYTACLDLALMKKVDEVKTMLEKMPSASIPPELIGDNEDLSDSTGEIAYLISGISNNLDLLRKYITENRLDEASETANETYKMLSQATRDLRIMGDATKSLGQGFKVAAAPPDSALKLSYEELWQRINEINDFIDLSKKTLENLTAQPKSLINTQLTLSVEPNSVFVGDNFLVEGVLTASGGRALNDRNIEILLGGSKVLTVTTDSDGRYRGIVTMPYKYLPEQEVQALYLPQGEDLEIYASSSSLPVKITVLYYETKIYIDVPEQTYPGLAFTVAGRFDYGEAPVPESRAIEIYIDDTFISRDSVIEEFTLDITIDQSVGPGKHILTIATLPMMRYSGVVVTEYLNVTSIITLLDIELPGVLIGPRIISEPRMISMGDMQVALGGLSSRGRVWSEVGDLENVLVEIILGDSQRRITPNPDGTFNLNIEAAMSFILFGSQELEIKVLPQQLWHAPLNVTKNILVINVINCSITIIILIFLGIFLSLRLKKSIKKYQREKILALTRPVPIEIKPVYTVEKEVPVKGRTVKSRLLQLYMGIVGLILRITHTKLKPEQTMREFSEEHSTFLGEAAKYFMEFTRLIEKLFYSSYEPSSDDSETGKKLYDVIKKEFKDEVY